MSIMYPSKNLRPLVVDFDLQTDGDKDFESVLIVLMIGNLNELKTAWHVADQKNDWSIFSNARHKMTTTLRMLNDKELTDVIAHLQDDEQNGDGKKNERVAFFNEVCDQIVRSLQHRLVRSQVS